MLMPFAIPTALRTIPMAPVYDEWRLEFMTRGLRNSVHDATVLVADIAKSAGALGAQPGCVCAFSPE